MVYRGPRIGQLDALVMPWALFFSAGDTPGQPGLEILGFVTLARAYWDPWSVRLTWFFVFLLSSPVTPVVDREVPLPSPADSLRARVYFFIMIWHAWTIVLLGIRSEEPDCLLGHLIED